MATSTDHFKEWRATLSPIKVDIVSDFSGRGLFAIHGEALLAYCLETADIDFDDGFQLLHAVHAAEAFLAKLKSRGCNFHVLWFDREADACIPPATRTDDYKVAKYRLARAALIQHFACPRGQDENASAFSHLFPSLESSQFQKYLETHPLHFFLGSNAHPRSTEPSESGTPLHMLYLVASTGHCVASIEGTEIRSSKVYLSVETPKGDIIPLKTEFTEESQPSPGIVETMEKLVGLPESKMLTAREFITLSALSSVLCSAKSKQRKVSGELESMAVVVHLVLLRNSGLSQRSLPVKDEDKVKDSIPFLTEVFDSMCDALTGWFEGSFGGLLWDGFDLFDGRLYINVMSRFDNMTLPEQFFREVGKITLLLEALSGITISHNIPELLREQAKPPESAAEIPDGVTSTMSTILPFSHPVLDQFLADVKLESKVVADEKLVAPRIFEELTHWHNSKNSVDPKAIPKPPGFFARKRNQKFMADTIAYSASLTGASGKNIEPETIIVDQPTNGGKPEAKVNHVQAKNPVAKNNKKSTAPKNNRQKALEEAEARQAEKVAVLFQAVVAAWKTRCSEFEKQPSVMKRYAKADKYFTDLSLLHRQAVGSEVLLYLCNVLLRIPNLPETSKSVVPALFAMLWSKAIEASRLPLTKEVHVQLAAIGDFFKIPHQLPAQVPSLKRTLPFTAHAWNEKRITLTNYNPREFQLDHCGPYLERSFNSAPDSRVSFHPDEWQRRVLDAIDDNKSVLAIAPTSAGKTFISFYAMKKVLQASDEGILVYVAPTKALVNQIAAEIQARFSKNYQNREAKSVWAIHTRDYRVNNYKGCQVLVTVPSVLQILLMAPHNANQPTAFSRRIKRIIFDEVHSIGQSDEGIIWEQLLLLAPCPIIALSATIGNPMDFKSWLEHSQKLKGYELQMVVHNSRYSELRKFIHCPPPAVTVFKGLQPIERLPLPGLDSQVDGSEAFAFLHPVGSIVDKNRETLNDATLEPRDCLSLWNCMKRHETAGYRVDASLDPKTALPEHIKKADVVAWETRLKDQLAAWMADPKSPFDKVRSELRGERYAQLVATHTDESENTELSGDYTHVSSSSVFGLVLDLRSNGALPAILFNYDRVKCEEILKEVIAPLKAAEEKYRQTDSWTAKVVEYEKWKKTRSKPRTAKKTSARRGDDDDQTNKAEMAREAASRDGSKWDSFDPDMPITEFSFADTTKMTKWEFEERLRTLEWNSVRPHFIDALRRGVGVHHAGMNRQYRQVVEILFRKGYLSVVVSTGTLAMGINMPCKTVVFTGDSVFLTALNYRQASGRAGRRGFDVLGNVVFHNIPPHRALEIMTAKLPDLRGQFPTSVTLILRLFILLHGSGNSEYAVDAAKSLFTQSRLYLGGPADKMSIVHHLRFSIDYLQRQHLLSRDGTPLNLSGLVGHLYYTENAVFAFHALLKEGYFHKLCSDFSESNPAKQKDIGLEIVLTLCHLFGRIPCFKYDNKAWLQKVHRSSSVGILPDLPTEASNILLAHNRQTLSIFQSYVHSYITQHLSDVPDETLPLTGHSVGSTKAVDVSPVLPCLPPTTCRSPFAALSGLTDKFSTIRELAETVRDGVFLDESTIPYIAIAPTETNGVPWNAYLLDFFKHGDTNTLAVHNDIKKGDVWFLLKDFSLILATIITSLENFMNPNASQGDDGEEDDASEEMGGSENSVPGLGKAEQAKIDAAKKTAVVEPVKKKKKVVADSWDDEASDSEPENWEDDASTKLEAVSITENVPSWEREGGQSLVKVHQAFVMVRDEFDEKFRKMWA